MEKQMKLSQVVKPISYFKAHASEVVHKMALDKQPVVITLNGEAKAILQDIHEFEQTQESLALLKLLAMSSRSLEKDQFSAAQESFSRIRQTCRKASR